MDAKTHIEMAIADVQLHNKKHPCRENSLVITKLEEAQQWLRTRDERLPVPSESEKPPVPELLVEQQPPK